MSIPSHLQREREEAIRAVGAAVGSLVALLDALRNCTHIDSPRDVLGPRHRYALEDLDRAVIGVVGALVPKLRHGSST
jgi:hypothetical protein